MVAADATQGKFSLVHDSLQAHEPSGQWSVRMRRQGRHRLLVVRAQLNFYYFWEKRWFFFAMAVGAIMLNFPTPPGLTSEGWIVLTMSVVATIRYNFRTFLVEYVPGPIPPSDSPSRPWRRSDLPNIT